jgi:hypothetical protein
MEEDKGFLHLILAVIAQGIIVGVVLFIAWPVKMFLDKQAHKIKEAIEPEVFIPGQVTIKEN